MKPPTHHSSPTLQQRLAERERPATMPVMHQRWENLLFIHWRWDPVQIQQTLPPGLTVDTYHGGAWLGLTPLFMRNVRPSFVPPVPFVSDFLELNLRTYVYDRLGRPGVYFYSLDCDQPLVVETARRVLHLRYEHSMMRGSVDDTGTVELVSQRADSPLPDVFRYRATSEAHDAEKESLDFFLLERYRLFTEGPNSLPYTIRIHHNPYRIRSADVVLAGLHTLHLSGFDPKQRVPDHVCAVDPVEPEIFLPERVPGTV